MALIKTQEPCIIPLSITKWPSRTNVPKMLNDSKIVGNIFARRLLVSKDILCSDQ